VDRLQVPFSRAQGSSPFATRQEIQEVNWNKVGVVRNQQDLQEALGDFVSLRDEINKTRLKGGKIYNMEYAVHLDTLNMIEVSVMAATSALLRDETRGAHTRSDFLETRDDYGLFNIFIKRGANGLPECDKREVAFTHKTFEECQKHKK